MFMWKNLSCLSVTLKTTLAFGIASFAISGINYITTPIFTRLLSPSEYGVIAVYNSWFSIVNVFATMTLIYPGILHVGLYEHSDNRWKYLSTILGIITSVTCFFTLLFIFLKDSILSATKLSTSLIILMLLSCLFQAATTLWTTKQRYEYNYKITTLVTVGSALLAQIFSIFVILYLKDNSNMPLAEPRLWSAGIINIFVGLGLYIFIFLKGRSFVDIELWKSTFFVALPLIPHYLSSVILTSSDKIMISQFIGDDKAGIYSLATVLSSIGVLFWRALSTVFSPFVNTKLGAKRFQDINESVTPLLTVVGCTCFLGALTAPEIITIMATKEYLAGLYVIPPVVIGIYLHAMYDVFSAVAFFHKKSVLIMMASVIAAIMNIVLNYFCIKSFGYIAAGYTTLFSNLILTLMHYANMRHIEDNPIYNKKFLLCSVIVVTCACLTCNLLYHMSDIIRYIIICLVLWMLFLQRKSLVRAINNMKV